MSVPFSHGELVLAIDGNNVVFSYIANKDLDFFEKEQVVTFVRSLL